MFSNFSRFLRPLETRLVYPGAFESKGTLQPTPQELGFPFEQVSLLTADGVKLAAWALPQRASRRWLLYLHGNGGNISGYLPVTTQLVDLGHNVLSLEYRGYGASEGQPSETGLYEDAHTAYRYLLARGVLPKDIVLYGFSLGTGVAIDLATRAEVGALIVEAGYTSLPDVARTLYSIAPTRIMENLFASKDKIAQVTVPSAFIHAKNDRTVPYAHGRELHRLTRSPKLFIDVNGGHLAMLNYPQPEALSQTKAFLDEHLD